MLNPKEFIYIHNGKEYKVILTRKRIRSIRYYYKNGEFRVSAPLLFVTQNQIKEGLDRYADKLLKADVKTSAFGNDFIYLLGIKVSIHDSGEIKFSNNDVIKYKSREDLEKKLKKWFLEIIKNRNAYYEHMMGVKPPYKVHVKKMSTRYGSNSLSTHSLSYSTILMHYSYDVIDSVIIHELAHHFQRNHSKKFYDVVYKYCPNYRILHNRLKRGEFHA